MKSLADDMRGIIKFGDADNFGSELLRLIIRADGCNKEKIRKGFPDAVHIVEHWRKTGEVLELPDD